MHLVVSVLLTTEDNGPRWRVDRGRVAPLNKKVEFPFFKKKRKLAPFLFFSDGSRNKPQRGAS